MFILSNGEKFNFEERALKRAAYWHSKTKMNMFIFYENVGGITPAGHYDNNGGMIWRKVKDIPHWAYYYQCVQDLVIGLRKRGLA